MLDKSLIDGKFAVDQEVLDKFWLFIAERQMIWHKRFVLGLPAPWTNDPHLRDFKFTNVYRELDRGTVYLLDHIINQGKAPIVDIWNIIIYRMFNRISTFEAIGVQKCKNWDREGMYAILEQRYTEGLPLWTDAHMVCAYEHFPGKNKWERFQYIFDNLHAAMPAIAEAVKNAKGLESIWKILTQQKGIGPFLAYEMAVDISYCEWNNLHDDEWVNPGPGCQRGLKSIFPGIKPQDCQWMIKVLRQAQKKEFARLKIPFDNIAYDHKELTLRNIEHSLCEFYKMHKIRTGVGRPRNRFSPVTLPTDKTLFKRLAG